MKFLGRLFEVLERYLNDRSVLLLGNGINRFGDMDDETSWEKLLLNLSKKARCNLKRIPQGYPYTEIFDILFSQTKVHNEQELKNIFIESLRKWKPKNSHKNIILKCEASNCNVITTNFDKTLEYANNYEKKHRVLDKGFTHHYPWQVYYTSKQSNAAIKIWHVHGVIDYPTSVKLSVNDYAGNMGQFHKYEVFEEGDTKYKKDYTWLNEFMEKKLVILGLSLAEQEFFIRSLLIKKKKYSDLKSKKKPYGYYIDFKEFAEQANGNELERKDMFLKSCDIEKIEFEKAEEIYSIK